MAQARPSPDWPRLEAELLQHFRVLLRFDTSNPPGNEKLAVDYLRQVLDREGIPTEIFALEPARPNLVARLKGSGRRQPISSWGAPTSSRWTRRNGRFRRSARGETGDMSTAAAHSTIGRISWPA